MLYLIAQWLDFAGPANLVRYQSFRAGAVLMTALFIGLIIGTGQRATFPRAAPRRWAG